MQTCSRLPAPVASTGEFDVRVCGPQAARADIEAYIARRYLRSHDARIDAFMPLLLAAAHRDGYAAALGLRPAGSEPLFLERYLDAPIETAVAAGLQQPIERARVVEVGHLAASCRSGGQLLIVLLIEALRGAGFRWLVCTATRQVRALVQSLGLPLHALAAADPARLGEGRAAWGRYYEAEPLVMAGDLAVGVAHIRADARLLALTEVHAPALARLTQALR